MPPELYERRPLTVTAEVFDPRNLPWPDHVYTIEPRGPFSRAYYLEYNHGQRVNLNEGNVIVTPVDAPEKRWPYSPDMFRDLFAKVG